MGDNRVVSADRVAALVIATKMSKCLLSLKVLQSNIKLVTSTCASISQENSYSTIFSTSNCIPDAKRGYYGFIIVVVRVRVRALVRVRRDFLLATYSPHFFPDFFHIWQVT